jgi:RNA polymerase sigma factor (TIGR02999 family)
MAVDVTELLRACRAGERAALERLLPILYDELRDLAARAMARERGDHTLEPTALVHEAWLKLVDQRQQDWNNRSHFLAIAATAMRRILVNHAEAARAQKRGGGRERIEVTDVTGLGGADRLDVLALDEALTKLAAHDERKAKVVELRFFAGLSEEEVALTLGVTTRTVERDWRMARAWLRVAIDPAAAPDDANPGA